MTLGEQLRVDQPATFETAPPEQPPTAPPGPAWQQACARLTANARFSNLVIAVILANAITLGLGTFATLERDAHSLLQHLDDMFLWFFCAELLVRLAAVGFRPDRFLRRGWNIFDLIAIAASFIPGLGTNGTALRLVRLLRVTRLLNVMPEVPVLLNGLRRAARPVAGILLLTLLLMYLYGVVGWALFHEGDPKHWGNLSLAFLTLFQLLTLDQWPDVLAGVRDVSPFAIAYVLSFILLGGFVIVELMIGVVITSLDEAHEEGRAHRSVAPKMPEAPLDDEDLAPTIAALRAALDDLERRTTAE